jgi:hypothetical protein
MMLAVGTHRLVVALVVGALVALGGEAYGAGARGGGKDSKGGGGSGSARDRGSSGTGDARDSSPRGMGIGRPARSESSRRDAESREAQTLAAKPAEASAGKSKGWSPKALRDLQGRFQRTLAGNEKLSSLVREAPFVAAVLERAPDTMQKVLDHPDAIRVLEGAHDHMTGEAPRGGRRPDPKIAKLPTKAQAKVIERIKNALPRGSHGQDGKVHQPGYLGAEAKHNVEAYVDRLLAAAAEAQPKLNDTGREIARGPPQGRFEAREKPKDRERVMEKVAEYGDASRVTDLAAGRIVYPTLDALYAGVERASRELGDRVVDVKDRFAKPADSGYRDVLMNVKMDNGGHIAELRFELEPVSKLAGMEHAVYEIRRGIEAQAKEERRDLTGPEAAFLRGLSETTKPMFEAALKEGVGLASGEQAVK